MKWHLDFLSYNKNWCLVIFLIPFYLFSCPKSRFVFLSITLSCLVWFFSNVYLTPVAYSSLPLSPPPTDNPSQDEQTANKLWLLPHRSPSRNNAKWMLCWVPQPFTNRYGGIPCKWPLSHHECKLRRWKRTQVTFSCYLRSCWSEESGGN